MISDKSLQRFTDAQKNIYPQVVQELANGKKASHWMWFIFPQIDGLGLSATSKYYSIKSIEEAKEYSAHPVLGKRLTECTNLIIKIENKSADEIFGYPDNIKLQSCMTLFSIADPSSVIFAEVLKKYFKNEKDKKTTDILHKMQSS